AQAAAKPEQRKTTSALPMLPPTAPAPTPPAQKNNAVIVDRKESGKLPASTTPATDKKPVEVKK
ncbi:MAG: hypothetical protein K2X63_07520, partial [Burkholderiaceae bacterium]|nr:hypothetical protein [Burkholderiaceae bacterium]